MVVSKIKKYIYGLARVGVWFAYAIALAGSFEQALGNPGSPIWSSVFGFPILHHYLIGFILLGIGMFVLEVKVMEENEIFKKIYGFILMEEDK